MSHVGTSSDAGPDFGPHGGPDFGPDGVSHDSRADFGPDGVSHSAPDFGADHDPRANYHGCCRLWWCPDGADLGPHVRGRHGLNSVAQPSSVHRANSAAQPSSDRGRNCCAEAGCWRRRGGAALCDRALSAGRGAPPEAPWQLRDAALRRVTRGAAWASVKPARHVHRAAGAHLTCHAMLWFIVRAYLHGVSCRASSCDPCVGT